VSPPGSPRAPRSGARPTAAHDSPGTPATGPELSLGQEPVSSLYPSAQPSTAATVKVGSSCGGTWAAALGQELR
jgi:hypothetical protein